MKKFQNELQTISHTISELAIRVEALAEIVNEEGTKMNSSNSPSSLQPTTGKTTILDTA